MAVVENARASAMTSSNRESDTAVDHRHHQQSAKADANAQKSTTPTDQNFHLIQQKISNGHHQLAVNGNGVSREEKLGGEDDGGEGFKREMRDLEEMLSKLNPMAEEFVPPSLTSLAGGQQMLGSSQAAGAGHFAFDANGFMIQQLLNSGVPTENSFRRKKNGYTNGKRRMNSRTSMAQRDDVIKRTVYVSDIDHQVTEEQLAGLFIGCGQVVDCRVCGDPNSVLRFAFVEFTDEEGARNALSLAGTMLGYYPVRVLPSKTAIAPVNPTFLPRSEDEREMCARTIYCTNIDKKVTQADVKLFFESICGEVHRLRLLGDYHHSTRISFVEFVMAESAIAALNCSGAVLGSLPIRVSPSKTPVRPRSPRQSMH
ncbi:Poly(A) RNA polymerase cid13 [Salvia divinorum]|uniref:Poly(A) RNA polymerase cid13 n=1 Tax=Salvia divinorum TaxID=28513 RepID=A0ABD1H329_SALDI